MTDVPEDHGDPDLKVTVNDEDDGSVFHLQGEPEGLVRVVVDDLYANHLHRERRQGDRLRCEGNGQDVFAHVDEQLKHYRQTECHQLIWNFVGDTGGAKP